MMQLRKVPLQPPAPAKPPSTPHSGEGSHSALEALRRVVRDKPAARGC
jgi:hypothetical protein